MRPLTLAATGLDHCPCSTCSPGPIARHTTSPECLFTAIKLGARGDGTRVWPSFWPLEVETISRSPTGNTSLLEASCGKTPRRGAHVQLPDDVGRSVVLENLFAIWTAVLAIAETLRVEATELALGGDVVQAVPFHIRRTRRRREQELPHRMDWGTRCTSENLKISGTIGPLQPGSSWKLRLIV